MLELLTLGGFILLLVGADKLGGWSLLLVGARKSGSWSFLLVGASKHIECNLCIINNIFCVSPKVLGFPRKNIVYCVWFLCDDDMLMKCKG